MAIVPPTKRSIMTLYSKSLCPYSHRARIVLEEKGVTVDILDIEKTPKAREELLEINPYGKVPTLVDRDLIIYESLIIMEYLDERFPHPPLMPVYPVARARARLMMHRINKDWYGLLEKIHMSETAGERDKASEARKELQDSIVGIAPAFADQPFFFSEEFSLIDCCMAPLLWRLPALGIQLPPQAKSVLDYAAKIFKRESFMASLSPAEQALPRLV